MLPKSCPLVAATLIGWAFLAWGQDPDPAIAKARAVFQRRDQDASQTLSREEFLAQVPDAQKAAQQREFQLCDFDRNETLSWEEFQCVAGVLPNGSPRPLPDAIALKAEQTAERLAANLMAADGDVSLDMLAKALRDFPELKRVAGPAWDSDQDGLVTPAELQAALRVAYGLTLPSGASTRNPDGSQLNWAYFRSLDRNSDGKLSLEEFQKSYLGADEAAKRFPQMDADQDGFATLDEVRSQLRIDPLGQFRQRDRNLDGRLDVQELSESLSDRERILYPRLIPGFDADQDGHLSFLEWSASPAGQMAFDWMRIPTDRDRDGRLGHEEFQTEPAPLAIALSDLFFGVWDADHDGRLTYAECPMNTDLAHRPRDLVFQEVDKDGDGVVDRSDLFLQSLAEDADAAARRTFAGRRIVFDMLWERLDGNSDDQVSREEFLASDWGAEAVRVGTTGAIALIPDPVADEESRLSRLWAAAFATSDKDQDGRLTADEWKNVPWDTLTPMQPSPHAWWDADQDTAVTLDECQTGLKIAFCLERPDGTPLRDATHVYNLSYFSSLDANHDGKLAREEFTSRYYLGPEKAAERFKELDKSGQGFVTFPDVRTAAFRSSIVDLFLNCDTNLDGRLSLEELAVYRTYLRVLTERMIPNFDRDGDGHLSFAEFRRTPLADESLSWTGTRNDADGDGRLSAAEFRPGPDLVASGLSDLFFLNFDQNGDGGLSLQEFPFTTDMSHQPRELVFDKSDKDQNQQLEGAELFSIAEPKQMDAGARKSWNGKKILFEAARARADQNGDGVLSREEFLAGPWGVEALRIGTTGQSRLIPDPITEIAESRIARLDDWLQADGNQDAKLDAGEWAKLDWSRLAPLAPSPLDWWDQNQDGEVSRAELERGLRLAFALEDPAGVALRTDRGIVYNRNYFQSLDKDHDGLLTKEEFAAGHYLGKEKAAARFDEIDTAKKGRLTFPEIRDGVFRTAVLDLFLGYDTDFDGQLTREELLAQRTWLKPVAQWILPGFDTDGNGTLSLLEFRGTPLADETLSWTGTPSDANRDGRMTAVEFRPVKSLFASGLSDLYFRGFDLNRDGVVTYDERPFQTDPTALPPDVVFRNSDVDHNDRLTREELFRHKLAPDATAGARKQFISRSFVFDAILPRVDRDNNGEVTLDEFRSNPWGVELVRVGISGTFGSIPDPVADLVDQLTARTGDLFQAQDTNQDEALQATEWEKLNWADLVPLAPMPLEWWDANADGQVSQEEWQRGLRVAFSLERPDGTPLRSPQGRIYNHNYFLTLDTNRDGQVSREEFTKRFHLGPEKSGERFDQLDADNNGQLTFADMHTAVLTVSIVDSFQHFDVNVDGKIEPDELRERIRSWQKAWVEFIFPGFDTNRDGALSFLEFRLTPYADESQFWTHTLTDANQDGWLSPQEFRPGKDLAAAGLSDLLFRGFDVNQDGRLGYDELPFSTDLAKLPREVVFRQSDRNADGQLDEAEIFRHTLTENPTAAARKSWMARRLACDAALARVDRNSDRVLSLEEFQASDWGIDAIKAGSQGSGYRLPDPQTELAATLADRVGRRFDHFDTNQNGRLEASEWAAFDWSLLAPLSPSPLAWWDRDQDQGVSREEIQSGLLVAFSAERPDGALVRPPTGHVYNLAYFLALDKNHDETLTADEFKAGYYLGPEKSAERFATIDPEGTGKSYREIQDVLFRGHAMDLFLNFDENLDGQVSRDELTTRASSWQRAWLDYLLPAFDADGDGHLNLMEFRRTPLADQSVSWSYKPNDVNRDGVLTAEEFRPGKSLFATGLSDSYFAALDRNRDGKITYGEFPFTTDLVRLPRDLVFQMKDTDKNGSLTFKEAFPDKRPDEKETAGLRSYISRLTRCDLAFRATDTDHNQELSLEEFSQGPFAMTSLSAGANGPIPDPMDERIQEHLTAIFGTRPKLSQAEWSRILWTKISPDLEGLDRGRPDANRDGSVTPDEAVAVLEEAYGVTLPNGFRLRTPTGQIFNVTYFDGMDADHDGVLSRSEFVAKFYSGPEAAAKQFETHDKNGDGHLDRDEAITFLRDDRLGTFLHFDRDFSGTITAAELNEFARSWEKNLVATLLPAFDLDGNGGLSFHEATLSPLLNRIQDWNARRKDSNNDSYLTFDEFGAGNSLFATALRRMYFRIYDRDGDGKLSYDEFPFEMDLSKVPAEVALKVRDKDRDGVLKFEEFFTEARPASGDQSAMERYEMRLAVAETRFLADDINKDGALDVAEYKRSQEATLKAVERKTRALSRHQKKNPSNLPFIAFLVFDALALAGGGWYAFKKFGR